MHKVLIINGSPRENGNTSVAVSEVAKTLRNDGIEPLVVRIGSDNIRGCIACGYCLKNGKCVFNDKVNELSKIFEEVDGLIVASPVYYASANATLIATLDRLFYSSHFDMRFKVGASIAVARRGGCSSTFDELNKYLLFLECRLYQASTGTAFMGVFQEMLKRILKDFKQYGR